MRNSFARYLHISRARDETPASDTARIPGYPARPSRTTLLVRLALGWWRWALVLLTTLVYAHLAARLGPLIQAAAGGLLPFDLRWAGYSLQDAHQFLQALSPEGLALYRGLARLNDTLVPLLLAWTLCLPLRRQPPSCMLPALTYAMLDLAENVAVDRLLVAGPMVEAGPVALASGLTQAKFIAAAVAVAMAVWSLDSLRRARRAAAVTPPRQRSAAAPARPANGSSAPASGR